MGMDVYGKSENSYFRANCWSWRPIHAICDFSIIASDIAIDTKGWDTNDGNGLSTQEECNELADAIVSFLKLNNNMCEFDDRIYLCLGSWCSADGGFLNDEDVIELKERYPFGTVLYNGVVSKTGALVFPSHSSSLDHIEEFITFLRTCGGFEIW
jgi:hypothetical protein